ncbi:zinc finger and SCAN domain-containing protein 22 [Vicugna pacos]|uniref:Zinc finger and SCAN domain-containing protein 22 n=1 Tax=Vicugna pacos TaxID=30538 RepID=A0ABM5DNU1_VICPA
MLDDPKVELGDESKALDLPCAEMEPQALSKAGTAAPARAHGREALHAQSAARPSPGAPASASTVVSTRARGPMSARTAKRPSARVPS